jgi:hypothetical protein
LRFQIDDFRLTISDFRLTISDFRLTISDFGELYSKPKSQIVNRQSLIVKETRGTEESFAQRFSAGAAGANQKVARRTGAAPRPGDGGGGEAQG